MRVAIDDNMTAEETAVALLRAGLWPTVVPNPTHSKNPHEPHRESRPSEEELRRQFADNPGAGVGVVTGKKGGIIDVDVDGEAAAPWLDRLFPGGVPPTLGWQSARGPHHLFLWDGRFDVHEDSIYFDGLEIHLGLPDPGVGRKYHHAVCAPTPGRDGTPRSWLAPREVLPLPDSFFAALPEALASRGGVPESAPILGWHFLRGDGAMRAHVGKAGEWGGFLACESALDALNAGDGPIVARVEAWGRTDRRAAHRGGRLVAEHIRILWKADASEVLRPIVAECLDWPDARRFALAECEPFLAAVRAMHMRHEVTGELPGDQSRRLHDALMALAPISP